MTVTDAASIVTDIRAAIELLGEADDAAALRVSQALAVWLRGTELEDALGLVPGWRQQIRQADRAVAIKALLRANPGLDDSAHARRIAAGIAHAARRHGVRPDGEAGYHYDLARLDEHLSESRWRRLVAEHRGHCNGGVAQAQHSPLDQQEA